jgi:hypothetical protein
VPLFPAIKAVGKSYEAYLAVDASGTFNDSKREAGLLRMQQGGRDRVGLMGCDSGRGHRKGRIDIVFANAGIARLLGILGAVRSTAIQ